MTTKRNGKLNKPALSDETIRRIEQATGRLATQSVARMDEQLQWFRELPAEQRSWVMLVAQAGLQSFVDWLRSPDDVVRLTGEVFGAAPAAMARSVSLQRTVELVRTSIAVAEENVPLLAAPDETELINEQMLRFGREIAFAAARVYAIAAEARGLWDDRLEALVIDNLVRGSDVSDALPSQIAALGWHTVGPVAALVGTAPDAASHEALVEVRRQSRRLGLDVMAGVHGTRLVVLFGATGDPGRSATRLLPLFGDGPVVLSETAPGLAEATDAMQAALAALRAAPAWPAAPRPVTAEALLPERALAGDTAARAELVRQVYQPLAATGDVLVDTVNAFLDAGGGLETTARALFVHVNTVRYRLRRVAEICGETPTEARGAFTLRLALAYGRLDTLE